MLKEEQTMKTYQNQDVAQKIADKLTKKQGVEHIVEKVADGFVIKNTAAVEEATPEQQLQEISNLGEVTEKANEPAPVTTAKKSSKPSVEGDITFDMPNSRETPGHIISSMFMGRERWIRKEELKSFEFVQPGVARLTMGKRHLLGRDNMKELLTATPAPADGEVEAAAS